MPQSGHVYVTVNGPSSKLVVHLGFSAGYSIYDVLAGDGVVEANAEFAAAADPENVPSSTPGYGEDLAAQMQGTLNEVSSGDVLLFIDAMREAGTPEEIGAVAWEEVENVYERVSGGYTPSSTEPMCIEIELGPP